MKVQVNNKEVSVSDQASLLSLVKQLDLPLAGIAIAVNQRVINRSSWSDHTLIEGDKVDIIKAACGG